MASVASFFVSRVDTAVDTLLEERLRQTNRPAERAALQDLSARPRSPTPSSPIRGTRISSAASAVTGCTRRARGRSASYGRARARRTRDTATSAMSMELVGPDTVNTIPPATVDAFRHHGRPRASLEEGVAEARQVMAALDRPGVSLDDITDKRRMACDSSAMRRTSCSVPSRASAPRRWPAASTARSAALAPSLETGVKTLDESSQGAWPARAGGVTPARDRSCRRRRRQR